MHSEKNKLNDRKSENYVKSDRAKETETFRQKRPKEQCQKGVVGRIRVGKFELNSCSTICNKPQKNRCQKII